METMTWWIWYISFDMVAFIRRAFVLRFCGPLWVGYEHVFFFLPAQSVVSFFLCFGHIVIEIFSSSLAKNIPERFRIKSTSLTFSSSWFAVLRCPELIPRLVRCEVMSSLQASKGMIFVPIPSKLQTESGELKEHIADTLMFVSRSESCATEFDELTSNIRIMLSNCWVSGDVISGRVRNFYQQHMLDTTWWSVFDHYLGYLGPGNEIYGLLSADWNPAIDTMYTKGDSLSSTVQFPNIYAEISQNRSRYLDIVHADL